MGVGEAEEKEEEEVVVEEEDEDRGAARGKAEVALLNGVEGAGGEPRNPERCPCILCRRYRRRRRRHRHCHPLANPLPFCRLPSSGSPFSPYTAGSADLKPIPLYASNRAAIATMRSLSLSFSLGVYIFVLVIRGLRRIEREREEVGEWVDGWRVSCPRKQWMIRFGDSTAGAKERSRSARFVTFALFRAASLVNSFCEYEREDDVTMRRN